MPTLIVVDMQDEFIAASDPMVINGVINEIHQAKERLDGIVFLQYGSRAGISPVKEELFPHIQSYPNVVFAIKYNDDGSDEAITVIKKRRFDRKEIWIVGVNTCACVWLTADGIAKRFKKSKVVTRLQSCGCEDTVGHKQRKDTRQRLLSRSNMSIKGRIMAMKPQRSIS